MTRILRLTDGTTAPPEAEPWYRPLAMGLAAFAALQAFVVFLPAIGQPISTGRDFDLYLGATRSLLSGGPFYDPAQLAGPYTITMGAILYPPSTIPLFVPFLWLPTFLWWAVPLGITAWIVWSWRPSALAWSAIAVCLTFPNTVALLLNGNPVMWAAAGVALGTRYRWAFVLAFLKPSVAVVALLGVRDRRWWLAGVLLALTGLPFLGLWPAYVTALDNSHGSLLYSLGDLPAMLIPVVAWLGRGSRQRDQVEVRRDGPGSALRRVVPRNGRRSRAA